jgi:hypothetical protein
MKSLWGPLALIAIGLMMMGYAMHNLPPGSLAPFGICK